MDNLDRKPTTTEIQAGIDYVNHRAEIEKLRAEVARLRGLIDGLECYNVEESGKSCATLAMEYGAWTPCQACRAKLAAQSVDATKEDGE